MPLSYLVSQTHFSGLIRTLTLSSLASIKMSSFPPKTKCSCYLCPLHTNLKTHTSSSNAPSPTHQPRTPTSTSSSPAQAYAASLKSLSHLKHSIRVLQTTAEETLYDDSNHPIQTTSPHCLSIHIQAPPSPNALEHVVCLEEKGAKDMLNLLGYLRELVGDIYGKVEEIVREGTE
ncbi:hypothetical protein BDZ45DRAFT_805405 [Acephala macrosclerotiorum]|nr:hypothetical protein BDZ45DRAFT_805405 [Acephala macrosclerotiorum]